LKRQQPIYLGAFIEGRMSSNECKKLISSFIAKELFLY